MNVHLLRVIAAIFSISLVSYVSYFHMSSDVSIYLSCMVSLSLLAFLDRERKSTYPILVFFFLYQTIWTALGYILLGRNDVSFLFLYGANDFVFMVVLIKFYKSPAIHRIFKVKGEYFHFPQLQWIAGFIALSCFFKLAAFAELMIHEFNRDFFQDFIPFFFMNGQVATAVFRVIIEVLLWVLVIQSLNSKANTNRFLD